MALNCRVATLLAMTDFAVASYHGRLGLFIDRPRAAGARRACFILARLPSHWAYQPKIRQSAQ